MKIKFLFLLILFAFLGVVSCNRSPQSRADWIEKKLTSKLSLSPDQVKKLDVIKQQFLVKREQLEKGDRDRKAQEFKNLFLADQMDQAKLKELAEEPAAAKEMKAFAIAKAIEFHDMLTPAQRQLFVKEIEKMNQCHKRLSFHHPF
jgi:hypothetical protein